MEKLFGTSGIRGIVGEQITPELIVDLGSALATHLGNSGSVVVGKDPRISGDMFESCVISGLLSGGCDVKRIGTVPTPVVGFAVRRLKAKAGVMVTASHNPPQYNGVKLWDSGGMAYTPQLETKIENIYFDKQMKRVSWGSIGKVERVEVLGSYIEEVVAAGGLNHGYRVVVDCGNGSGSLVTPNLLRRLGCKVTTLNSHPDGTFPGRGLEPSAENLEGLYRVVKSIGADLGIAHDGDADRIAAVDETGRVAQADKLLALVAAHQVDQKENVVVTTVDASSVVDEAVGRQGGKVMRTPVGDVNVAAAVKEHNAVFGGEPSGAWIFPRFHLAPDGPLAAVEILKLLESTRKKLSKLLDGLPDYQTAREKLPCPNSGKASAMKKFESKSKEFPDVVKLSLIDGVRLEFEDGWVLVRPSGTEPYIRVTAESRSSARARELAAAATKVLKSCIHD